jgi:molecular chaperone DnaK (HSP70)
MLGGKDWDNEIVEYALARVSEQKGIDSSELFGNAELYQKVITDSEKLKIELTKNPKASLLCDGAEVSLTRDRFEELTKTLLQQTTAIIDRMYKSKDRLPKFDDILLVGGSTRMPQVRRILEKYGVEINSFREDEAVACGAAIYANPPKTMGRIAINSAKSFGIFILTPEASARLKADSSYETTDADLMVSNVLKIHSRLPVTEEEEFKTVGNNQSTVSIRVIENTSDDDCIPGNKYNQFAVRQLGEGTLSLAKGLPAGSPITVSFKMDDATGLYVVGKDPASGNTVNIPIKLSSSQTDEEIEKLRSKLNFAF